MIHLTHPSILGTVTPHPVDLYTHLLLRAMIVFIDILLNPSLLSLPWVTFIPLGFW